MDQAPNMITITEDAEITSYNLCAATDMAATCTSNNRVKLWNLNWRTPAAELITILQEKHPVKFVCFNNTGSQLASLLQPKENEIEVKIWDPKNQTLLYNFTSSSHTCKPHNLYYSHDTKHPLLCMEHSDDKGCNTHLWSCKKDKAIYRGCIVAGHYYHQMPHYWPYAPQTHRDNSKKAGIEKYESNYPLDFSNYLIPYRDNKKIVITLLASIMQKHKDD
jgi:hypothetical protein